MSGSYSPQGRVVVTLLKLMSGRYSSKAHDIHKVTFKRHSAPYICPMDLISLEGFKEHVSLDKGIRHSIGHNSINRY